MDRLEIDSRTPARARQQPGRSEAEAPAPRRALARVLIGLALIALTLLVFPHRETYDHTVSVGDVWLDDDVVAPFDFAIYKTEDELRREIRDIRRDLPQVFSEVPGAQERVRASVDSLAARLERVFRAYGSWQLNQSRGNTAAAAQDSARYFRLRGEIGLSMTARQWSHLLGSYAAQIPGLTAATREGAPGRTLDEQLLDQVVRVVGEMLPRGVLDVPRDSLRSDQIVVLNRRERIERFLPAGGVIARNEAFAMAQNRLREAFPGRPDTVALGVALFRELFHPSLVYQREETLQRWQRRERRISPTREKVQEGQVIVERGEVVDQESKAQLTSLMRHQTERGGRLLPWRISLAQLLLTLSTFLIFYLYLYLLRRKIFQSTRYFLLVSLLFAVTIGLYGIAVRLPTIPTFAVPVAIVSILLTVIFDSRVGMFGTITLALLGGLIFGNDFEFMFATVFAGALAVFSVRDIRNRSQFFLSAGIVFAAYLIVIAAFWLLRSSSPDRLLTDVVEVAVNAVLLLLTLPLIWVFERAFGVNTDVQLLELSDTNRPLLKELSLRSPGTFNHSLQVANLSEAAASAIGANALLTRVGALYHDIGKMLKPEYFIENQRIGENPHDRLSPHRSALIIASHVKDGIELGRQYRLPQEVLDFIVMHHGTTRMEYFYRRALDQQGPDEPPVQDEEFRYPGPRPNSQETGILMLADSVEAASRSMEKPTRERLEALIDSIFKARIEDQQLIHCPLTFDDLRIIRETFLSVLSGIFHFRVKYPGGEQEGREALQPAAAPEPAEVEELPVHNGIIGDVSLRANRGDEPADDVEPPETEPPPQGGDSAGPEEPSEAEQPPLERPSPQERASLG